MQLHKNSHNDTLQPHHELLNIYGTDKRKRMMSNVLYAFILIFFILV